MLPAPLVSVWAPLNVESVITADQKNNRYIIHFVAFLGVRDAHSTATNQSLVPLMEEMWRYRARIQFEGQVRHASALSSRSEVREIERGVQLDTGEIHEAVIVDL
jgi:hypothetical protein